MQNDEKKEAKSVRMRSSDVELHGMCMPKSHIAVEIRLGFYFPYIIFVTQLGQSINFPPIFVSPSTR